MTSTEENVRKRIEGELERVNRVVVALKKEPRAEELEGFGDNTPLSEEIDAILAAEERELRSDRLGRLLDRAAALDEALHRLENGLYGICIVCGEEIAPKRLSAIPEALRCNRCQESFEKSPQREEVHGHEWKLAEEVSVDQKQADSSGEPDFRRRRATER